MKLTRERAEELLRPYFSYLAACPVSGWRDWRQLPSADRLAYSRRTRANIIHDRTMLYAKEHRPSGIILVRIQGLRLFAIGQEILFRFKKLRPSGRASNVRTQQELNFSCQRPVLPDDQLWLPECDREPAHLNVGYVLNHLETEIARVIVTFPSAERKIAWSINITSEIATPLVPMPALTKNQVQSNVLPMRVRPEAEAAPKFGKTSEREKE